MPETIAEKSRRASHESSTFVHAAKRAKGGLTHTIIQLSHAFTVNYGPHMSAGNMATKREAKAEWGEIFPRSGPEFEELIHAMAIDGRIPKPTSAAEIQNMYERLVLDDPTFEFKGEYTKQAAWYSIMKSMHQNDAVLHARRYHNQKLSELMMPGKNKKDKYAKVVRDLALALASNGCDDDLESAEGHRQAMQDMRKRAGNMLLLSPVLMHNVNLFNSRVMLLVATVSWTEQAMWSVWKTTPEADRTLTVQLATGAGEDMLRRMWQNVVEDPRELARWGWRVVAGLPVIDVAPCPASGKITKGWASLSPISQGDL